MTTSSKLPALPWQNWALLLAGGVLVFRPVTQTWSHDPNYSFGWWIPLVALLLFVERWPSRPRREGEGKLSLLQVVRLFIPWALLFFFFRVAVETDSDWRPGLWMIVGLYLATLLCWLWLYGGRAWLRHFAFPVCFLLLSLPWFYDIEHPVTQGLMQFNAMMVALTLRAIAISAQAMGNIIHLQNCDLGVEEACSGILSLQAALMMGCLLGEIYGLTLRRRLFLVLASMTFALVGNYLRTLFLALMAFYNGPEAITRWHDIAGFSILFFTGVSSWLAALFLQTLRPPVASTTTETAPSEQEVRPASRPALQLAVGVFLAIIVAEVSTQAWFGWRESSLTEHPKWTLQFPKSDSFHEIVLSDALRVTLHCDEGRAGAWRDAHGWNWMAYWFQYDPKPYNRIVMGWHNPDNCLPAVGLTKDRDFPNFVAEINGLSLTVHPKRFLTKDSAIYLFWVVYPQKGGLPPEEDTRLELSFSTKVRSHLQELWEGNRGVGVETLEVAITGPPDYESAQAGYLAALKGMAIPHASGPVVASGASH